MKFSIVSVSKPKKVSKSERCPICDKPDWCFSTESTYSFDDGMESFTFVSCRRELSPQAQGYDGQFYIFDKVSRDGVNIYEEVNQRSARHSKMGLDKKVVPSKRYEKKVPKNRIVKCENKPASIERINEVLKAFLELLTLEEHHVKVLKKDGWDDDLIAKSGFKTLPEQGFVLRKLIQKKKSGEELSAIEKNILNTSTTRKKVVNALSNKFNGDLHGIPGFYQKKSAIDGLLSWDVAGKGGMILPMYDIKGRIFSLRIRLDYSETNKYKWHTSYFEKTVYEDEKTVEIDNPMLNGTGSIYGVSYLFPDYQTPFLFVTEGEKKQKVVVEKKGLACANIPGVSGFGSILKDLDELKSRGIQYIIVGYDADKSSNTQVLRAELNLIKSLYESGFEIFIANWQSSLGKGVDDVILNGGDVNYVSLVDYLENI